MIKKNVDNLYICMYSLMRTIKKERANQDLASKFLGICFAFNVNTFFTIIILVVFKSNITGSFALFVPLAFVFFYFFNQKYFINSGRSRHLTMKLLEKDFISNQKPLWAVVYIFFSIFIFWIVPILLSEKI